MIIRECYITMVCIENLDSSQPIVSSGESCLGLMVTCVMLLFLLQPTQHDFTRVSIFVNDVFYPALRYYLDACGYIVSDRCPRNSCDPSTTNGCTLSSGRPFCNCIGGHVPYDSRSCRPF